jgi:hypothetical protein
MRHLRADGTGQLERGHHTFAIFCLRGRTKSEYRVFLVVLLLACRVRQKDLSRFFILVHSYIDVAPAFTRCSRGRWGSDKILRKGLPLSVNRKVPV